MMAELCPVCNGSGMVDRSGKGASRTDKETEACHGCNGSGCVNASPPVVYPVVKEPLGTWNK